MAALAVPALAHSHPGDVTPPRSAWAEVEVSEAWELGLVNKDPAYLPQDYRVPITRRYFCELAMDYIAVQNNCDSFNIVGLYYTALEAPDGTPPKDIFYDGNRKENVAGYLGIVEGRGDGTFDPEGLITRQEAAAMLARAYRACGGILPEQAEVSNFSDQGVIADWAKASVEALAAFHVFLGRDDGTFDPEGPYTVEQSIVTFLRLYNNAPVSRKNGTVFPHFSYEECLYFSTHSDNYEPTLLVEGKTATLVESTIMSAPHNQVGWKFVYREGGIHFIDWGVCMNNYEYPELENPRFSEDGNTFFCSIILERDYPHHQKGIYQITMDVKTCHYQIQREDLKT